MNQSDFPGWQPGVRAVHQGLATTFTVKDADSRGVHVQYNDLAGLFYYSWEEVAEAVQDGWQIQPTQSADFAPLTTEEYLLVKALAIGTVHISALVPQETYELHLNQAIDKVMHDLAKGDIQFGMRGGLHLHLNPGRLDPDDVCTQCRRGED